MKDLWKISLKEKYTNYKLTLPIQLILNCNGKISSGKAKIVVEGLGVEDEKSFELSGIDEKICKLNTKYEEQECKETKCKAVQEKTVVSSNSKSYEKLDVLSTTHNYEGEGIVIYESSSSKAKNILPYLILFSFALIILVLFIKK